MAVTMGWPRSFFLPTIRISNGNDDDITSNAFPLCACVHVLWVWCKRSLVFVVRLSMSSLCRSLSFIAIELLINKYMCILYIKRSISDKASIPYAQRLVRLIAKPIKQQLDLRSSLYLYNNINIMLSAPLLLKPFHLIMLLLLACWSAVGFFLESQFFFVFFNLHCVCVIVYFLLYT